MAIWIPDVVKFHAARRKLISSEGIMHYSVADLCMEAGIAAPLATNMDIFFGFICGKEDVNHVTLNYLNWEIKCTNLEQGWRNWRLLIDHD